MKNKFETEKALSREDEELVYSKFTPELKEKVLKSAYGPYL